MKRGMLLLLIVGCLSGCATASKTYTSDGKEGHVITCSGSISSWGECYDLAGKICGTAGYDILEKSGDTGATLGGGRSGFYGGSVITRIMVIQCKE